jgi:hypothetical protein
MPAGALLFYALVRWVQTAALKADPWDPETGAAVNEPEATPVCHHCLTPLPAEPLFCPECGCAVGAYNNLLPYPYVFSLGEVFRNGTLGRFRLNVVTIVGFFLVSLLQPLFFLVPVYWFFLLRNVARIRKGDVGAPPASSEASA